MPSLLGFDHSIERLNRFQIWLLFHLVMSDKNRGPIPSPVFPHLVATYPMKPGARALVVSEGIDRDRAVDENGNQLSVFGRVGARPFNFQEQRRLYMNGDGTVWKVSDDPYDAETYDYSRQPPQP